MKKGVERSSAQFWSTLALKDLLKNNRTPERSSTEGVPTTGVTRFLLVFCVFMLFFIPFFGVSLL